ncbi:sigma-70 family RNA polymerase sigma factor [Acetobacter sacchari]|uniref:Sigma-70 family RNA polymerase sigma factor n=1 Tax=Acetobacter sacchari TaxID=2661687 RepID=A0ABS3LXC5_9PROT|nr:sigma-70 family RNA polymerase sigma factor [Acetobacter sacchari]
MDDYGVNIDSVSLEAIFRRHHSWLVQRLTRKAGSRDRAEELASEVFARAAASGSQINEPRAFLTIVSRRLMEEFRRRTLLEASYTRALQSLPETVRPSQEEQLEHAQTLALVESALAGLSAKARAAFIFARIEGVPHSQIAYKLGVSVSSVRKYIDRGDQLCRESLRARADGHTTISGLPRE